MLGKEALCRNRKRDLRQFISCFCPRLDKPRTKFFNHSLWGILNSSSLTVSKWLPFIHDRCSDLFYRHKRLLNQLHSRCWDHSLIQQRYLQQCASFIDPDTPLIIDLCDLPRPRARELAYLRLVRDGSDDGRLVYGYWCVELYAYLGHSRILPLILHPYSTEAPGVFGENAQILAAVDQVMRCTQGRGVLLMDRGADRDALLLPWTDNGYRFVVRLKGDRHLLLDNGAKVPALNLAEQLLQAAKHHQRAWCRVYLPERPNTPLHLVCKTIAGWDRPLMLLTSLVAQDLNTANTVLNFYRRRWKCEEAARFLKSDLGIERFALRLYDSFDRLFFLATLAMSFMTWLLLRLPALSRHLAAASPGRRKAKFLYYRLLTWLQTRFHPAAIDTPPP